MHAAVLLLLGVLLLYLSITTLYVALNVPAGPCSALQIIDDVDEEWNKNIKNCFFINLDEAQDRRARMETELERRGVPYRRIKAIKGSREMLETLCDAGDTRITPGELGAKLSHLSLLKEATASKGWTLVLEDDVLFEDHDGAPTAPQNFKRAILSTLRSLPDEADILHLGTSHSWLLYMLLRFALTKHSSSVWKVRGKVSCLHAYLISPRGAQKYTKAIMADTCGQHAVDMLDVPLERYLAHVRPLSFSDVLRNASSGDLDSLCLVNQDKGRFPDSQIARRGEADSGGDYAGKPVV